LSECHPAPIFAPHTFLIDPCILRKTEEVKIRIFPFLKIGIGDKNLEL